MFTAKDIAEIKKYKKNNESDSDFIARLENACAALKKTSNMKSKS